MKTRFLQLILTIVVVIKFNVLYEISSLTSIINVAGAVQGGIINLHMFSHKVSAFNSFIFK